MNLQDNDLQSIQEVRSLLKKAREASRILASFSQEKIDSIVEEIAKAALKHSVRLAKMANEETGFGVWQDKVVKNVFGSMGIYEAIKNQRTVGILRDDTELKVMNIGVPVGVVAGIIPSTNPTSTVMYKTLISIKAGNCIIFSPHPGARNCILETVKIIKEAASTAGCPDGAIGCITIPTIQATQELMKSEDTKLILATGGYAMVKAAYSSGTPAIGVGAGNGPAFIDKSANVRAAVERILASKTFDNGTICASEQSVIIERCMEEAVVNEFRNQGAYFLNNEEAEKLGHFILRANGTMNPQIVGKSVQHIANLAGLSNIPKDARALVAKESRVGDTVPYSREKLAPILAFYVEDNIDAVIDKVIEILSLEGMGHTFCMHTQDHEQVKKFSLKIPASRILINTLGALGGIGATTNLFPALTLGCGAVGGSSSSNNIGPLDLINIRRVAYGVKELGELKDNAFRMADTNGEHQSGCGYVDHSMVDEIVKRIMKELV